MTATVELPTEELIDLYAGDDLSDGHPPSNWPSRFATGSNPTPKASWPDRSRVECISAHPMQEMGAR